MISLEAMKRWLISRGYSAVEEDDASEDSAELLDNVLDSSKSKSGSCFLVALMSANFILFIVSILNLSRLGAPLQSAIEPSDTFLGYRRPYLNPHLKRTSGYSPILDDFDMSLRSLTVNGVLRDNTSIFRMPPSPEVDAAWNYISTEGMETIMVSSADVLRSGKDPSYCIKAPLSWGEGDDAYLAQIDVFHQIHCLNMLRRDIHYDYYYTEPPDELHKSHTSHCIHMILQNLMCNADVGIITHNWVHNDKIPDPKDRLFPDFNMVKQCRDFDGLLEWAREKSIKDEGRKLNGLRMPSDAKLTPGDGYA